MKHKKPNRTFGREAAARTALFRTLCGDLLTHGSITTTAAKGKELRRYIEPLITAAKSELTLHRRRMLLRKVRDGRDLDRLVEVARANADRPGGYTRLTKLPVTRHDNAPTVRVDIITNNNVQ